MNNEKIMVIMRKIVKIFSQGEKYLLNNDLNERTLTHKLAEYLQKAFSSQGLYDQENTLVSVKEILNEYGWSDKDGWPNVDCEYNRNMNEPKILDWSDREEVVNDAETLLRNLTNYRDDDIKKIIPLICKNKSNKILSEKLKKPLENTKTINRVRSMIFQSIFPDIIVHKRGSNHKNLIIIEVKKSTNWSIEAENQDINKILALMNVPYNYRSGFFIKLNCEENTDLENEKIKEEIKKFNNIEGRFQNLDNGIIKCFYRL